MALPASLYAVPAEAPTPRRKKRSLAEQHETAEASRKSELLLKQKIDQASSVLDRLEARASRFSAQIKALQKRKAFCESRYALIEEKVLLGMAEVAVESVKGNIVTLTARPCPASLVVDDESKLPEEYIVEQLVSRPDKIRIKDAMAKGVEFPEGACHLEQRISLIRKVG